MQVAPLPRRLGALAIDVAAALLTIAAVVAGVIAAVKVRPRPPADPDRFVRFWSGPWIKGLGLVSIVGCRNLRTPGQRVMGLRRVDARTGGPVTMRSAIIREQSTTMMRALITAATEPMREREQARLRTLMPQLTEMQRAHPDNPEARERAATALYAEHQINPLSSCLPVLLAAVIPALPALWTRRRQTPAERLAGVVVVSERPARSR